MTWRHQAACRTAPTGLFFDTRAREETEAKRICARCAVRSECLKEHATERFGVFAGLTAYERLAPTPNALQQRNNKLAS